MMVKVGRVRAKKVRVGWVRGISRGGKGETEDRERRNS